MSRMLKHFRLLAIVVCVVAVLLLQLRSSYLIEFWQEAFHAKWKYDLQDREILIHRFIREKLYEPFSPVHEKVKSFIDAETDVKALNIGCRMKLLMIR